MEPLRKGEYDLANISLIGFDPNTGRSFDDCWAEWAAERDRIIARLDQARWWQLIEQFRCRWQIAILAQRLGMGD
jgi:hypothetical protein